MIGNDELDNDTPPADDQDELGRAHVAPPGIATASSTPAAALRGLPSPMGSTEDLEARGLAAKLSPAPVAAPSAVAQRKDRADAELARLESTGSGISQIKNPFARTALRGLETIGSAIAPRQTSMIPGTELHHERLIGQQQGLLRNDLSEEAAEANLGKTGADSEEAQARTKNINAQTDALKNPKTGLTPEETTIHDLMTGENGQPRVNPATGKPYSYLEAYTAVNSAKESVKPTKPDTPEQQFIDDYQQTHKGASISDAVKAYTLATTRPEKPGAAFARSDKSYAYNNNKLDAMAKPIEDAEARMGRLRESLAQNTPQADALIAPELLTIMAGGAGSGLRMNEAEISRVVGGRSKWQSLQAAVNQWQLDPKKANSITPEQRQQIRDLTEAVNAKLQNKQKALDDARDKLLDSDDPKEHRRIVTDAHHALTQVDEGEGGGNQPQAPRAGEVENGYRFKGGNPADPKNWERVQ